MDLEIVHDIDLISNINSNNINKEKATLPLNLRVPQTTRNMNSDQNNFFKDEL